ncbi:exodeoxyribonuclease V subunit beta [Desulfatibacillum aliphaticivorans]|nr:exodeoxyribonuclease V subunit beta [Desulfatibacillum aliphaticivorans]
MMTKSNEAQFAPLEGVNLIEASAGTGKTYTLTSLYIRLLIEKGLLVDQILVVTFTVAATQELKDRIRNRLKIARDAFDGKEVDDDLVQAVVKEHNNPQSRLRVEDAIRRFDEAAVFTIHGFCQRVLGENAFESGASFDAELATDNQDFLMEIARDFWRREFYEAPELIIAYAMHRTRTPEYYARLLEYAAKYPGIRIIPQAEKPEFSALDGFKAARKKVADAWPANLDQVLAVFESGDLKANQYGKPDSGKAQVFAQAMDDYLQAGEPGFPLFPQFKYFCADTVQKAGKKGCEIPKLDFFNDCQELQEAGEEMERELEQYLLYLDQEVFRFAEKAEPERKTAKNIRFFNDLVLGFQKALSGPMGPALADAVRKKYQAALIDEFQDTDAAQYDIFYNLFAGRRQALFLIGDPKQAIYGFRGADLFSYLQASRNVEESYSLENNWRSSPQLIRGVNAVFSRNPQAFVLDGIEFKSVRPKPGVNPALPLEKGQTPPLEIWAVAPKEDKAVTIGEVQNIAVRAVASEVSRLLGLGEYSPSDIAVLVRSNMQAQAVRDGLRQAGVHSVLNRTGDLFETPEAVEIRRVMTAAAANRLQNVKAALSVSFLGWTAEELDRLAPGEEVVEKVLTLFSDLHEIWQKSGFMRMFTYFMHNKELPSAVLTLPEGERRLTNIMHLAEVLHQAEKERKLGVSGLIKWLDRQMDLSSPRKDEHQLRLESDAQAVQVVTMHGSKGLEFPVVFCPFMWQESEPRKGTPLTFHDPDQDERLTLDLRAEDSPHREQAKLENVAENVRLAYVALTRAKDRCYMLWGAINKAQTSAPAYLLHGGAVNDGRVEIRLNYKTLFEDLEELAKGAENAIALTLPPEEIYPAAFAAGGANPALEALEFKARPDLTWSVTSFSALSMDQPGRNEPGADEAAAPGPQVEIEDEPEEEAADIFAFPRGIGPGIMLHDIFENLDFLDHAPKKVLDLVQDKLEVYGFEDQWAQPVAGMVQNVLFCPLEKERPDFTLSRIPMTARSNEMEFYFPIKKITPKAFEGIFGNGLPKDRPDRLHFSPVKGFVHGFMDMVFCFDGRYYIVDWKSNHLGNAPEDYGPESLAHAMVHHKYDLQYLLYTLALDLHLAQRIKDYDYEKHFGGIFYIFLRGVDKSLGPEYGIFQDRPGLDMIQRLKGALL